VFVQGNQIEILDQVKFATGSARILPDRDRQALKAIVKDGRLVVNEPTDLPGGEVVELVPLDEVLANGGDYLDDQDRERLHQTIRKGVEDVKAGRTVEARKVIEDLRSRAAGR
jgi:hypothetical protein